MESTNSSSNYSDYANSLDNSIDNYGTGVDDSETASYYASYRGERVDEHRKRRAAEASDICSCQPDSKYYTSKLAPPNGITLRLIQYLLPQTRNYEIFTMKIKKYCQNIRVSGIFPYSYGFEGVGTVSVVMYYYNKLSI